MLERICWLVLALIHLSPAAALVMPSLISQLYDISPDDPNFALFHHRAALFGAIFVATIWAAVDQPVRKLVFVVAAISMIGFLAIYFAYGQPSALRIIALADLIGMPFLAYAGWKAFGS